MRSRGGRTQLCVPSRAAPNPAPLCLPHTRGWARAPPGTLLAGEGCVPGCFACRSCARALGAVLCYLLPSRACKQRSTTWLPGTRPWEQQAALVQQFFSWRKDVISSKGKFGAPNRSPSHPQPSLGAEAPSPARLCWALSTAGLRRARGRKPQLLHGVTWGLAEECEQFGTSWRYRGRLSPHQQGSERGRVRPAAQHPHPFPWVLMLSFFFPKCVFFLLFW